MGLGNGNAKSGDKGSNHNFEHRMLLALGSIVSAITGGGAAPVVRTPSLLRVTTVTTGTVAAGSQAVSIYNAHATAEATVNGITLKPGEVVSFGITGTSDTLAAINWETLVAADLLITTVV